MVNQGEGPRRGDEPAGGGLGGRLGNGVGPSATMPDDEQDVYVLTRKAVRDVESLSDGGSVSVHLEILDG